MSELPIDAQDLTPDQHIAVVGDGQGDQICRVLYTHPSRHFISATLLRLADDEVIQVRFHAHDSVRLATPAQVEEAEADGQRARITEGLEQLVRDIRQQKLPLPECALRLGGLKNELTGLTYQRDDDPATGGPLPEGVEGVALGRPVSAPPAETPIRPGYLHVGRTFDGHEIEDQCPCPQEPCGLVEQGKADPSCLHHPTDWARAMRQVHRADECPGGPR